MPRPSNTLERRQQIVRGLMLVMATSGYGGATIPLIAQAAGLSTGLVHYHFDSKQAILIELIAHLTDQVNLRFKKFKRQPLVNFVDAYLAYGEGESAEAVACWIAIGAEAITQADIRQAYQEVTSKQLLILEGLLDQALRAEGRAVTKKREIALGLMAAIEGSYRLLISAPDLLPKGFAASTVMQMASGLIAAQPLASSKRSK